MSLYSFRMLILVIDVEDHGISRNHRKSANKNKARSDNKIKTRNNRDQSSLRKFLPGEIAEMEEEKLLPLFEGAKLTDIKDLLSKMESKVGNGNSVTSTNNDNADMDTNGIISTMNKTITQSHKDSLKEPSKSGENIQSKIARMLNNSRRSSASVNLGLDGPVQERDKASIYKPKLRRKSPEKSRKASPAKNNDWMNDSQKAPYKNRESTKGTEGMMRLEIFTNTMNPDTDMTSSIASSMQKKLNMKAKEHLLKNRQIYGSNLNETFSIGSVDGDNQPNPEEESKHHPPERRDQVLELDWSSDEEKEWDNKGTFFTQ